LICLDLEGKERWNSSSSHRFGIGPFTMADNLMYVMDDEGLLSLVEINPDKFNLLTQAKVLGHESWGPMTLTEGRLIARDLHKMVCLNVAE
jgi:outer membrane protein assembly factor BamB